MKKIQLFFVCVMVVLWSRDNSAVAQTVSSAVKTVAAPTWSVTEPMIAVNPADKNNFIAVYSNWHDAISRYTAYSYTTNNGATWTGGELPFMKWYDQADPVVAFDADGKAYYAYLDINEPLNKRSLFVARSTNKGAGWQDNYLIVDETTESIPAGWLPDKPWITADLSSGNLPTPCMLYGQATWLWEQVMKAFRYIYHIKERVPQIFQFLFR